MFAFPGNSSTFLLLSFSFCCLSSRIIRLYSDNFEENVFLDNDPWIIGVENRIKLGVLERIYEKVKDRINVGVIKEKDLSSYFRDQVGLIVSSIFSTFIYFKYIKCGSTILPILVKPIYENDIGKASCSEVGTRKNDFISPISIFSFDEILRVFVRIIVS